MLVDVGDALGHSAAPIAEFQNAFVQAMELGRRTGSAHLLACAAERYDCLAMVKPQFEVGREHVGKGGVVRDESARRGAIDAVAEAVRALGASVLGEAPSGLPGPKGNLETFLWIAESGRVR